MNIKKGRRRSKGHVFSYRRKNGVLVRAHKRNPISNQALIIGGVAAVGVIGLIAYAMSGDKAASTPSPTPAPPAPSPAPPAPPPATSPPSLPPPPSPSPSSAYRAIDPVREGFIAGKNYYVSFPASNAPEITALSQIGTSPEMLALSGVITVEYIYPPGIVPSVWPDSADANDTSRLHMTGVALVDVPPGPELSIFGGTKIWVQS